MCMFYVEDPNLQNAKLTADEKYVSTESNLQFLNKSLISGSVNSFTDQKFINTM